MAGFSDMELAYLDLRRHGMGPHSAARELGSTAREIAAYMAANPDFGAAVDDAVEEAIEKVENKVMENGQDGDMVAARMILESHKAETWTKPDRDVTVLLGLPENFDVGSFTARLEAAKARALAIDVTSTEVEDGEPDVADASPAAGVGDSSD